MDVKLIDPIDNAEMTDFSLHIDDKVVLRFIDPRDQD